MSKNELQLVKTDVFGGMEYDIYSDNKEMYMTLAQLSCCLGYSSKDSIKSLLSRNEYLKQEEFSKVVSICNPLDNSEKGQKTRVFTEDGIYEVTMLAKTDVAKEFRARVRMVLKGIRAGKITAEKPSRVLEIKEMNARVRLSNQFLKLSKVETLSAEYKNILAAKAAEVLTGTQLIPLPKSQQKMYSAGEIGQMFGVSAQKIGRVSNEHNLKTPEYGEWYRSKSEYSTKEVDTFVYNDKAVEKFREILS